MTVDLICSTIIIYRFIDVLFPVVGVSPVSHTTLVANDDKWYYQMDPTFAPKGSHRS